METCTWLTIQPHWLGRTGWAAWLSVESISPGSLCPEPRSQEPELVCNNEEWQPDTPSQRPLPQNPFCAECKGGSEEGVQLKMSAHEFVLIIVLESLVPQTL